MFKSLAKTFKGQSRSNIPTVAEDNTNSTVTSYSLPISVNPEIENAINLLGARNPTADRIAAAKKLCSLKVYTFPNLDALWNSCKDLLESENSEARATAFQLLNAFIENSNLNSSTRVLFYNSIYDHQITSDFPLQLSTFIALTNNGKSFGDIQLSTHPIALFMFKWLRRLFKDVSELRSSKNKDLCQKVESYLYNLSSFITNSIKFNFLIFEGREIEEILGAFLNICVHTTAIRDIHESLEFINTLLIYGHIPVTKMRQTVDILAASLYTDSSLEKLAWSAIYHLLCTHDGNLIISILSSILSSEDVEKRNIPSICGAILIFQKILVEFPDGCSSFDADILLIMNLYLSTLKYANMTILYNVCLSIYNILRTDIIYNKISSEDWEMTDSPLTVLTDIFKNLQSSQNSKDLSQAFTVEQNSFKKTNDLMCKIIFLLKQKFDNNQFNGSKGVLLLFFLEVSPLIDEEIANEIVSYYKLEYLCYPFFNSWESNMTSLLNAFFFNDKWSTEFRLSILSHVEDVYESIKGILDEFSVCEFARIIFKKLYLIYDMKIINSLLDFAIIVCNKGEFSTTEILIEDILQAITNYSLEKRKINANYSSTINPNLSTFNLKIDSESPNNNIIGQPNYKNFNKLNEMHCFDTPAGLAVKAVGTVFIDNLFTSGQKCKLIYYKLISIASNFTLDSSARVYALTILFKIRVNTSSMVYLITPVDYDELSFIAGHDSQKFTENDDSLNNTSLDEENKRIWSYPEPINLFNRQIPKDATHLLKILQSHEIFNSMDDEDKKLCVFLDINPFLSALTTILEKETDWEIFSYILTHIPYQLTNLLLYKNAIPLIRRFRNLICEQLSGSPFPVVLPRSITKADVLVLYLRSLCIMLAYKDYFTKQEQDNIIKVIIICLASWDKTAISAIQILGLCCYEIPLSVKKFLSQIFTRLQTKITSNISSPHVIEFMGALSRLPSLTSNFTIDEFKRTFAMVFKYIQNAYDISKLKSSSILSQGDNLPESVESEKYKLSQFLLISAYNLIGSWYLALRVSERKLLASFISRNLLLSDVNTSSMDELGWAWMDLITRFTYSDIDLKVPLISSGTSTLEKTYGEVETKHWLYGTGIVSIETALSTGVSQITVRRPTGTATFDLKPDQSMLPNRFRNKTHSSDPSDIAFFPSFLLLQVILPPTLDKFLRPIPLNDDAQTKRAINTLDRTPVLDFHKIGVMYIGPGQRTEAEILGNSAGCVSYDKFLDGIGELIFLKDANRRVYTGGLDTENDLDGKFAYFWSDKITQMIFHTTTMMPTYEHDTSFSNKKRHIGNNYVNIYFNCSSFPFSQIEPVSSQFNFVNVIITPSTLPAHPYELDIEDESLGNEKNLGNKNEHNSTEVEQSDDLKSISPDSTTHLDRELTSLKSYFKVRTIFPPGVPKLSAAANIKIVSASVLPIYVRNLAMNLSTFALVWHIGQENLSNWKYRLEQINLLRNRIEAQFEETEKKNDEELQKLIITTQDQDKLAELNDNSKSKSDRMSNETINLSNFASSNPENILSTSSTSDSFLSTHSSASSSTNISSSFNKSLNSNPNQQGSYNSKFNELGMTPLITNSNVDNNNSNIKVSKMDSSQYMSNSTESKLSSLLTSNNYPSSHLNSSPNQNLSIGANILSSSKSQITNSPSASTSSILSTGNANGNGMTAELATSLVVQSLTSSLIRPSSSSRSLGSNSHNPTSSALSLSSSSNINNTGLIISPVHSNNGPKSNENLNTSSDSDDTEKLTWLKAIDFTLYA